MKAALRDKLIAFLEPMIGESEAAAVSEITEQIEQLKREVEEEPADEPA